MKTEEEERKTSVSIQKGVNYSHNKYQEFCSQRVIQGKKSKQLKLDYPTLKLLPLSNKKKQFMQNELPKLKHSKMLNILKKTITLQLELQINRKADMIFQYKQTTISYLLFTLTLHTSSKTSSHKGRRKNNISRTYNYRIAKSKIKQLGTNMFQIPTI